MIFVTGGTGLVGSHILLRLAQQGKSFKALKRVNSRLTTCERVFNYYKASDLFLKINWINGDINDIPSLDRAMEDCNTVIHSAGLVSFLPGDTDLLKKVNIEGTSNIVNIALSKGISKLGYVSSIATLGRYSHNRIIDENCYFKSNKLNSRYALSKYYAEQEVWRSYAEGLDVVIVNPSVILGPGNWEKGSSQIFQKIYSGLKYYTCGSTGYVDVLDVADVLLKLVFSDIKNERFILNGANLKYRDCFDKIAEELNKPKATIKVNPLLKEIAWRLEFIRTFFTKKTPLLTKETANSAMTNNKFSSDKIQKILGFQFTDINITIKKYSSWFIEDQL